MIEKDPTVSAVTGRQRVMESDEQNKYEEDQSENWISKDHLLRRVQSFDYEASLACFMGGFSMLGMLPVIPGFLSQHFALFDFLLSELFISFTFAIGISL